MSIADEVLRATGTVRLGQEALVQVERYQRIIVYEDVTPACQALEFCPRAWIGNAARSLQRDPSKRLQRMGILQ